MEKTILSGNGFPKHIKVQKTSFVNDDTAFIEAIPGIVFAVVISYVYLNVGTYMNGTIGSELVNSFPNNVKTGRIDVNDWYNVTQNTSVIVNLSSPNTADKLEGTLSKWYIRSNGSFSIYYNLTVNGVAVNTTSILTTGEGYNHTITSLISGGSVLNGNTTLQFQWDINSTESNTQIRIRGTYFVDSDLRTKIENSTVGTLGNVSSNYDSNINIIKIAITISVLLVPIMAIMSFRRFM